MQGVRTEIKCCILLYDTHQKKTHQATILAFLLLGINRTFLDEPRPSPASEADKTVVQKHQHVFVLNSEVKEELKCLYCILGQAAKDQVNQFSQMCFSQVEW